MDEAQLIIDNIKNTLSLQHSRIEQLEGTIVEYRDALVTSVNIIKMLKNACESKGIEFPNSITWFEELFKSMETLGEIKL